VAVKWSFCFQNSSTEHYQYTSKAAVIKLSFWVGWHVMLLMCCRLQELVVDCWNMTDRGLLEGIGSLHELTSLRLFSSLNLTAQAWSTFLHRPSMTSVVFFASVIFRTSGWWRVERNRRKVQSVNVFKCINVEVCLEHAVQVSVYGCEVSLSLYLYLQMHTFERIGSLLVPQSNWCWHQHGDKSLQSAARIGFEWSKVD
jgi:hypothetical protein